MEKVVDGDIKMMTVNSKNREKVQDNHSTYTQWDTILPLGKVKSGNLLIGGWSWRESCWGK